jgi:hypothetical protein
MGRFYIGHVCLVSLRLPVTGWAWPSWELGNFMLSFCWIYYISVWFALLLQCPWLIGLVFEWNHWVLVCSFCSSWVFFVGTLLFFSLISIFPQTLKFCLQLSLVCWSGFKNVYFIWFKELFISVWFFCLKFSISLLNSSFISCAVFFISITYILKIISLVSF